MKFLLAWKRAIQVVALFSFLLPLVANAWDRGDLPYEYSFPDETVIGEVRRILYTGSKTPAEIGRAFYLGYDEMKAANPGLKMGRPVRGKEVILPVAWVLPEVMSEGILINIAEMRLYFFHHTAGSGAVVSTFPIGIGRDGFDTPTGDFKVVSLAEDPTWFPSRSSKELNPNIPSEIPPGPKNPLGRHYIKLSINGYGIHGTNRPFSIGRRVSLGCIRLYPENVAWLFNRVYPGMPVRIIDKPVKVGRRGGELFVEVHGSGLGEEEILAEMAQSVEEGILSGMDSVALINEALEARGTPSPVPLAAPPAIRQADSASAAPVLASTVPSDSTLHTP